MKTILRFFGYKQYECFQGDESKGAYFWARNQSHADAKLWKKTYQANVGPFDLTYSKEGIDRIASKFSMREVAEN